MAWFPKSKVVVPIDFSALSLDAIHTALGITESPSGVSVLHVIPTANPASPAGIWGGPDIDDRFVDKATQHLEAYLAEQGIDGVKACVRVGSPGRAIPEFAQEINADLVVIPSHGISALKRFLIGSVAEQVVRNSECPTLVLRD